MRSRNAKSHVRFMLGNAALMSNATRRGIRQTAFSWKPTAPARASSVAMSWQKLRPLMDPC
eukprot:3723662-Pyramimonas_sp.AAC.1